MTAIGCLFVLFGGIISYSGFIDPEYWQDWTTLVLGLILVYIGLQIIGVI